jgi:hypothetical protein
VADDDLEADLDRFYREVRLLRVEGYARFGLREKR